MSSSPGPASPAFASPSDHSRPTKQPKRARINKKDPESIRYALISGFAGGIAGCVAKTSVAPLDRVKILFQTRSPDYARYAGTWTGVFTASKDIYAETGIRGLLQGHSATLLRIFPYAAIKFMAYEKLHITLMPTAESETSGRRFVAGSLAGVITTGITYPLELIRVRLAFESNHSPTHRSSLIRTIKQIYLEPPIKRPTATTSVSSAPTPAPPPPAPAVSTSGSPSSTLSSLATRPSLTHFYRGVFPTLAGIIPYAGTSFLVFGTLTSEVLPRYLSPETVRDNRSTLNLLSGGIAGAIGQTTAYPLDIIRRRMQVGPVLAPGRRAGFMETARGVYAAQGWRGFFVGLSIGYLKVVPMNAVSFATWLALKQTLGLDRGAQG